MASQIHRQGTKKAHKNLKFLVNVVFLRRIIQVSIASLLFLHETVSREETCVSLPCDINIKYKNLYRIFSLGVKFFGLESTQVKWPQIA
jgi:hypothetical protein